MDSTPQGRIAARAIRFACADGADPFRFLAAEERRGAYLAVLYGLLERRRAHEVEVGHEELRAFVAPAVESLERAPYDPSRFGKDLDQLRDWGNVTLRFEPARIRSIADRGRGRFLVRLAPGTAALLEFLEAQMEPAAPSADAGANLLADIAEGLGAARNALRQRGGGAGPDEDALVRALHLIAECDARTDRVARELVEFRDRLADFVAEPFRVAAIAGVIEALERYVGAYLERLQTAGEAIRRQGERLLRRKELLARAAEAEARRRASQPFGAGVARPRAPEEILGGLLSFFGPGGRLESLCERVNRETREAVRRIHRHVEEVRLKNARTEAIRARARELAALGDGPEDVEVARRFLDRLVASAHAPADGRGGTPADRAPPFRPARRHEQRRPPFRGAMLQGKRSTVEAVRELERRRLDRVSAFVEERILRGRPAARLASAALVPPREFRELMEALKGFYLHGGKRRPQLRFTVERPADAARALLQHAGYALDAPDFSFARRK